jgi:apolipoprotein D and lipocalin family protein
MFKDMKLMGLVALALTSAGCATTTPSPQPLLAPHVDLTRFMGDWYVLSCIPLWPEREAHNALESYRLDEQGSIRTTYSFLKGGFDGPRKIFSPTATVHDRATGAEWRMQFIWPFKSAYLIHHVDAEYRTTIVGGPNLRNVWIMARTPQIPEDEYARLVERAAAIGYDVTKVRRVPQRW